MRNTTKRLRAAVLLLVLALVAVACSSDDEGGTDTTAAPDGEQTFTIGISNNTVGNGWREQMICAMRAEAAARGNAEVVVLNRETDTAGQISDITSLISQGVDAILLNPGDQEAFNAVIEEAESQGIVVVVVDNAVTSDAAYLVSNDQKAYGELGARWLFEELGGEGNVAYLRGIDGVGADTLRDEGFQAALANYPNINVVAEVFTDWSHTNAAQQAVEILTTQDVDGIWTSGTDFSVVEQYATAGVGNIPIVGADNNAFIGQLLTIDGLRGVAVTNPPSVGGAGMAVALNILEGQDVPKRTLLTPAALSEKADLEPLYIEGEFPEGWSSYMEIEPYTSYKAEDVIACEG